MENTFIVFEGIDNAGKTFALSNLKKYLQKKNIDFIFTKEPGGTENKIREILLDKKNNMDDISEAWLYALDRRLNLKQIILPALKKGQVVFCDRYIDSSLAYQGIGKDLGVKLIKKMNNLLIDYIQPTLTIFFDIKPNQIEERKIKNNNNNDKIDALGLEFQSKVYEGYKILIKTETKRFITVDATKSKAKVLKQIILIINKELNIF